VKLFRDTLGYDYLGNWIDREGNANIEPALLRAWLEKRGVDDALIERALYVLDKAAGDTSKSLYDRNRDVYELLRYGVKVRADVGENTQTVWLIDWRHPQNNDFAIAEEVAIAATDPKAFGKRPDVVLYVNGIALGVLELKRSTVSVAEGIRQNLDNQNKVFIEHFFSTMQWVMAGNDTEGLRYGTIQTPEKYYLNWKEQSPVENSLDRALIQLCGNGPIPSCRSLLTAHGSSKVCAVMNMTTSEFRGVISMPPAIHHSAFIINDFLPPFSFRLH